MKRKDSESEEKSRFKYGRHPTSNMAVNDAFQAVTIGVPFLTIAVTYGVGGLEAGLIGVLLFVVGLFLHSYSRRGK